MTSSAPAEIPRAYDPASVEQRTYQEWQAAGYFTPEIRPGRQPFVIIMPPPNVTGELHLGHALTATIEDALTRWRRMCGYDTLWLPGKDHAGIATQWVVERLLAEEGTNRHELGREKFQERVWEWVARYGNTIDEQHKRLGTSCDWSRLRFTLDPGPAKAVRSTFVNLYRKGLIYRHERIINWCPRCATALSDLEVEYQEQDGKLYYIRYPLADGNGHITVATTRPESMLGDTGVAVHPEDPRYAALVGMQAMLPIMDRPIPIVGDEAIEQEFGTGALKVTPGHDVTDFEIGERHGLEIINVIGFDGNMTPVAGKYEGRERFDTRRAVAEELDGLGLLEKVEDYQHSVGHCQRCDSVVEPLISLQWFLKVGSHQEPDSIAGRAHAAVAKGDITIVPDRFSRVYLNWLENIRDWCISRQLWWGHRIPVWYCQDCGELMVDTEDPMACTACGSDRLQQDEDVLDTWFSSGLWPHSTLGWPDDTEDLSYFYPTAVMETGYDILFFWVARMIMMGIENTGEIPFRTVYLHGLIRDANGDKMSKTRGNTMDPLELIDRYGTDALRFALSTGTAPGNDLRITEGKLEAARNFANKVWNAARFVITSLEGQDDLAGWRELSTLEHREDRWIVSLLDRVTTDVNNSLATFELGEAQQTLYDFIWNEFCDWYIEMAKVRMRSGEGPSPRPVLAHVLERTLRLLHPFMPFITEEIWLNLTSRLPDEGELSPSIMVADYPQVDAPRHDRQAEEEISLVMQTIRAVRNTRAQLRIPANQRLEAQVEANGLRGAMEEEAEVIRTLSRVEPLSITSGAPEGSEQTRGVTLVVNPLVVRLPLEGVVDLVAEQDRLREELDNCQRELERKEKLVNNPNFRAKARPDVVETEEDRLRNLQEQKQRLGEILAQLGG
ncbi:MAG: valine--tRNA ligase [Chloroflexi bacterium]|nr:valine--tRNA ligase [Chloroflexota bacterium]